LLDYDKKDKNSSLQGNVSMLWTHLILVFAM